MANNLKILREERNWSQDEAAAAMGTTRNQYAKLEGGSRRLSDKWIDRAAEAYGIDAGEIVTVRQREIAIEGLIGAGSEFVSRDDAQGPLDYVEAPAWAGADTKALQVRGTSLGKTFDGWIIFYNDIRNPITDDMLGQMCVLGLADGRVVVKTPRRGQLKRRFVLDSNTEPPIYDAEVLWGAIVREMRPK